MLGPPTPPLEVTLSPSADSELAWEASPGRAGPGWGRAPRSCLCVASSVTTDPPRQPHCPGAPGLPGRGQKRVDAPATYTRVSPRHAQAVPHRPQGRPTHGALAPVAERGQAGFLAYPRPRWGSDKQSRDVGSAGSLAVLLNPDTAIRLSSEEGKFQKGKGSLGIKIAFSSPNRSQQLEETTLSSVTSAALVGHPRVRLRVL